MPRTNLLNSSLFIVPPTEAEAKQRALELYCSAKVVVIREIARKVGVSRDIVARWRDDGGWLQLRDRARNDELQALLEQVGRPEQAAADVLKTAKKIREVVDRKLAEFSCHSSADYLSTLTGIVAKVSEIQKIAYRQLGLKA